MTHDNIEQNDCKENSVEYNLADRVWRSFSKATRIVFVQDALPGRRDKDWAPCAPCIEHFLKIQKEDPIVLNAYDISTGEDPFLKEFARAVGSIDLSDKQTAKDLKDLLVDALNSKPRVVIIDNFDILAKIDTLAADLLVTFRRKCKELRFVLICYQDVDGLLQNLYSSGASKIRELFEDEEAYKVVSVRTFGQLVSAFLSSGRSKIYGVVVLLAFLAIASQGSLFNVTQDRLLPAIFEGLMLEILLIILIRVGFSSLWKDPGLDFRVSIFSSFLLIPAAIVLLLLHQSPATVLWSTLVGFVGILAFSWAVWLVMSDRDSFS